MAGIDGAALRRRKTYLSFYSSSNRLFSLLPHNQHSSVLFCCVRFCSVVRPLSFSSCASLHDTTSPPAPYQALIVSPVVHALVVRVLTSGVLWKNYHRLAFFVHLPLPLQIMGVRLLMKVSVSPFNGTEATHRLLPMRLFETDAA